VQRLDYGIVKNSKEKVAEEKLLTLYEKLVAKRTATTINCEGSSLRE
jgi:hypothetical protein